MTDLTALLGLRHSIHQHPELSGFEDGTANRVANYLNQHTPSSLVQGLGGTGLAAIYEYGNGGPSVLFRCELDALPIQEDSKSLPYASSNAGISHKCGHDGHAAIVAGLAPFLKNATYSGGRVILLFQPAEETGDGAKAVLDDVRFEELTPDFVFALHNLPGYAKNLILHREGIFTAAVRSLIVHLQGTATHAAEPEKGINPALALAEILQRSDLLSFNKPAHEAFGLITPVYSRMGDRAYGMSAGEAELHFTLRAWTNNKLESLISKFLAEIQEIGEKYQVAVEHSFIQSFASCHNNVTADKYVVAAALANDLRIFEMKNPFKWGEDFGLFTQRFAGALFGIGGGLDLPPLHHRDYDFPDEIIETGIKMFATICDLILSDTLQPKI
jgi:amidohydrolase